MWGYLHTQRREKGYCQRKLEKQRHRQEKVIILITLFQYLFVSASQWSSIISCQHDKGLRSICLLQRQERERLWASAGKTDAPTSASTTASTSTTPSATNASTSASTVHLPPPQPSTSSSSPPAQPPHPIVEGDSTIPPTFVDYIDNNTDLVNIYVSHWNNIRNTYRMGRIQNILNLRLTNTNLNSFHPT